MELPKLLVEKMGDHLVMVELVLNTLVVAEEATMVVELEHTL